VISDRWKRARSVVCWRWKRQGDDFPEDASNKSPQPTGISPVFSPQPLCLRPAAGLGVKRSGTHRRRTGAGRASHLCEGGIPGCDGLCDRLGQFIGTGSHGVPVFLGGAEEGFDDNRRAWGEVNEGPAAVGAGQGVSMSKGGPGGGGMSMTNGGVQYSSVICSPPWAGLGMSFCPFASTTKSKTSSGTWPRRLGTFSGTSITSKVSRRSMSSSSTGSYL